MILEFTVMMVGPGFYVVTAIMVDGPPVQVGVFSTVDDVDDACDKFRAEHQQQLH